MLEMIPAGLPELIGQMGVVGALGIALGVSIIRNIFAAKKEAAIDNLEINLYENLVAENKRMSEVLANMTTQLNVILTDNTVLLQRVASLEASVKELSVWETKALELQSELINKDREISSLKLIINDQTLELEKYKQGV